MAYSSAIDALKQAIPNGVFTERGEELYEKLNGSYLSGFESDLKPVWIVQPRTKEDVAAFLKVVSRHSDTIEFAIRGGGQQPLPGCANIQDGITLDLSLLTGIESKHRLVKVGAGERWGSVYKTLEEEGLAVAGGRSASNGIGGLALEGWSPQISVPCRNVLT
jgi:FAD/FMN-containing dehydrogenase